MWKAEQKEKSLRQKRERQRHQAAAKRATAKATRNAPGIMTAALQAAIVAGARTRFALLRAETSKVPATKKVMHLRGREDDLARWWAVLSFLRALFPGRKISQSKLAEARTINEAKRTGRVWKKREAQTALARINDLVALGIWPA
jgi:hypothetical protein